MPTLTEGWLAQTTARVLATLGTMVGRAPERVLVSADGKAFVGLEALAEAERAGDTHVVTTAGRVVALKGVLGRAPNRATPRAAARRPSDFAAARA